MRSSPNNSPHDTDNTEAVYKKLARYLDDMPAGFPATEDGLEIRLLRRFFTPEEAEFALHVTLIPEETRVIARRAKISLDQAKTRLTDMSRKGLIFSFESEGKPATYMSNQFVIGIWEYHVNDLDPELIRDMNAYMPKLMDEAWKQPQLRTIPVNQSITAQMEVTTYEQADKIIEQYSKIAVAPCICRKEKSMVGEGCDAPMEACLVFGQAADYYIRNGIGRYIDHDEARQILQKADKAGLVLQPGNSQKAANICCCCGCCCGVLRNIKPHPKPAELISSAFHAVSDHDNCDGCGICLDRCPMDAIELIDEKSTINLDRCIGCGLCVTTCPTEALSLQRKPEEKQKKIPKNNIENYLTLGRKRGKLSPGKLVMMQVKSKVDRFLASKT